MEKKQKMVVNRHVFERRPLSTEGFRVPIPRPPRNKSKVTALRTLAGCKVGL